MDDPIDDFEAYIIEKYGPPPKEMTYRAIGVIIQAGKGIFRRVRWEDGEIEGISLPELKPLSNGQRFEAMVTRSTCEPHKYKLLGMKDVKPLPPLKSISREEALALWERVGGNNLGETVSWADLDEDFWLADKKDTDEGTKRTV